jgi:hypothetical protein
MFLHSECDHRFRFVDLLIPSRVSILHVESMSHSSQVCLISSIPCSAILLSENGPSLRYRPQPSGFRTPAGRLFRKYVPCSISKLILYLSLPLRKCTPGTDSLLN